MNLKKIYKQIIVSYFHLLYGKVFLSKVTIKKREIKSKLFNKKKYYFYEFDNVRVYTDTHENVSIVKNNRLIKELSYQQIFGRLVNNKLNQVLKTGTPKPLKKIQGNILMLAQGASGYNNYTHWLLDIIPRIKLFSLASIKKLDFIYLNKPNKVQKDLLKVIGYNNINFINSLKNRHIFANKLFMCTHPNYQNGTIMEAHSHIPIWIIKYIKKKYIHLAEKKVKKKFKIFIDRSDSIYSHCKFINNEEIKKFLISRGFKIVRLSNLSLKRQISIFNNSEIIIGPHGAGFANLIFCKKKTKVIEIKPNDHPNIVYERISKINMLNYKLLKIKKVNNNSLGDMMLKVNLLKKYI